MLLTSGLAFGQATKIREGAQTSGALPTAQGGAPAGGSAGSPLIKNTGSDYDYSWTTSLPISWTAQHQFIVTQGGSNATAKLNTLFSSDSTGTPAAGWGGYLLFDAETTTTNEMENSRLVWIWTDATHASRTAAVDLLLTDNAITQNRAARFFASKSLSIGGSTTDPGTGVINADVGFKQGGSAFNFSHLAGDFSLTQTPSATADKLIGRGNGGGAGDWQEITLGTNLSMTGTTLNAAGGSGSPGGTDKDIQFNDGGSTFNGENNLEYDKTAKTVTLAANQNVLTFFLAQNTDAGTGAQAVYEAKNGTSQANYGVTGTGLTPFGDILANEAYLYTDSAVGLLLMANNATGKIVFAPGGSAEKARLHASGGLSIGNTTDPTAGYVNVLNGYKIGNANIIDDTAFGSGWNGVNTKMPASDRVYDWGHIFDTDDDGKVNVLDIGAGIPKTDSGGVISLATSGVDYMPGGNVTGHGDSIYTILSTDRLVYTNATLTAARIWTMPAASSIPAGAQITVFDAQKTTTAANFIQVQRAGSDTFVCNGSTTTATYIDVSGAGWTFVSDGTSKWFASPFSFGSSSAIGAFARISNSGIGWSTWTLPDAAPAATGKIMRASSTSSVAFSTPTWPDAVGTSGKILQSDGTNVIMSTPTWPTNVTAGYDVLANGTNYVAYPGDLFGASTAQQTWAASEAYLAGSTITIAAGDWKVQGTYHCSFDVTKTSTAGTATPIIKVYMGTLGTTSDTVIATLTFPAQTAVADNGTFDVQATFRSVGSGTSAVLQARGSLTHNLSITGLSVGVSPIALNTSAGFNSTTQTKIGISATFGTSFVGTTQLVSASLFQP